MPVSTSDIDITESYPTIRPSLNLNFARSRALDPRVTFTRASIGTYVGRDGLIKTAGVNQPRFDHDPETLESLGLLIEEPRTNYLGNSRMLFNWGFGAAGDSWEPSTGSQLSANPDGSSPAYHYSPSSTAGYHRFNRSVTVPTLDTNYVVSLFVKRVTAGSVSNLNRYVELEVTGNFNSNSSGTGHSGTFGGSAVTFDMQNLVIESQTNLFNGYVGDAKIEDYGNGWYRLSYVFNPGVGSNFTGQVWWGHCNSIVGDTGGETGNGNPSFYFWGASVENGSFTTSHIPTPANSSVTRAADKAEVFYDGWYDNSSIVKPSTFVGKFQTYNLSATRMVAEGSNGVTLRDFSMNTMSNSSNFQFVHRYTANDSYGSTPAGITINTPVTFAFSFDGTGGDITGSANGSTPTAGTDDLGGTASGGDRMRIGSRANNSLYLNGTISELRYYKFKASSAQLLLLQ